MLLWLNGTSNSRWDVNENYARELKELFCLGAGRGYTERDVRELARALTGFRNDWSDAGPTTSATTASATTAAQAHLRQARQVTTGGTACGWSRAIAGTRRSWSRSSGATSSRRRRRAARRGRSRGCTSPTAATSARCSRRSCATRPLRPATADGQAAGRAGGGDAARRRPRDRHDRVGVAVRQARPVPVHAAQRLRLGRHAAGWTPRRSAPAGRWRSTSASRRGSTPRRATRRPPIPPSSSAARPRFWGRRRSRARPRRPGALRRRHAGDRRRAAGSARPTRVLTENALRMLVATSPDYLTC